MKNTLLLAISILLLQSCKKEKIDVQEIEGYFFASNPKYSTGENTVNSILEVINKAQENSAVKNGDTTYVGFSNDIKNENTTKPKIENTDYMFVFNQKEFNNVLKYTNPYGQTPKTAVNFEQEFVFIIIHPSKFSSQTQYFDGLEAQEGNNENTISINPKITAIQYIQNENPIYNYGENDPQIKMFSVPKSKFKDIKIEWENGELETVKIGK